MVEYCPTFGLIAISQFKGFDDDSRDVLSNHVVGILFPIHLEVLLMCLPYMCTFYQANVSLPCFEKVSMNEAIQTFV